MKQCLVYQGSGADLLRLAIETLALCLQEEFIGQVREVACRGREHCLEAKAQPEGVVAAHGFCHRLARRGVALGCNLCC